MSRLPPWIHPEEGGIRLDVLVQPRASRTRAVGEHDGRLKVQVAAPPVEGEANAALVDYLSEVLKIPKRDIQVLAGATGRRKSLRLSGVEAGTVSERLASKEP